MKKITLLFSAVLIFTLSFYSCEDSQLDPTDPESIDFVELKTMNKIDTPEKIRFCGEDEVCLWAGQNIDAGTVTIRNDDENLYITVYSKDGFQKTEEYLKIDVVTTLPDKRPNAGHFPFKTTEINNGNEITYQIPYSELTDLFDDSNGECEPHQLNILVHVDIIANGKAETAWGGCDEGAGSAWWYNFEYYTQCCECWCGFGNDYQNYDAESCKKGMFKGEEYIFWSNKFNFDDMEGKDYSLSLLVNPTICEPQNVNGEMVDNLAYEVGRVVLKAYKGDGGMPYVDVIYTLDEKYKGYNIQLDLYNGADRVPGYSMSEMKIIQDDLHRLYQTKLTPGEVTYTFTIPWLTNDGSKDTYIALHSAIGDCPMPSLQEPYKP